MSFYYSLLDKTSDTDGSVIAHYRPSPHSQGAWNEHEQHMAPAAGILSHELMLFDPRPDMLYARLSYDILGLIPLKDFTITTRSIRPGRTIELIESSLSCEGKVTITLRAWRLIKSDTTPVTTLEDRPMATRDSMSPWPEFEQIWRGGYVDTVKNHIRSNADRRAGKSQVWLTNELEMVEGVATSSFVKLIGMVDTNNGVAIAQGAPFTHMFPNIDLQIHLYREPQGEWLGLDAQQQYGPTGVGLSSAILHDELGPFGHCEQILTVRTMPKT